MGGEAGTVAIKVLIEKARSYQSKDGYLCVKVFSKDVMELDALTQAFGGNAYRHGSGQMWAIGDKRILHQLAETLRPHRKPYDHLDVLFDWADSNKNPYR